MDYEKIIIYAALGLAYYAYKQFFKNFGTSNNKRETVSRPKEPVQPNPTREDYSTPSQPKAEPNSSIFDLLEEIKKQEWQQTELTRKPVPVLHNDLETTNYEKEPEKVKIESVNPYLYTSVKMNNAENISDTSSLFEEYKPKRKQHPFLKIFKDKSKIKEAFIMSEIMNKRY